MTPQPLVTVPVGTTLEQAKTVYAKASHEKLLVVDSDNASRDDPRLRTFKKAIKYPRQQRDDLGRIASSPLLSELPVIFVSGRRFVMSC